MCVYIYTHIYIYTHVSIHIYISIYRQYIAYIYIGFPGDSVVKNSTANAGDVGSIPGSGRSPGEGNGNPLQSSCLERGDWWATVHQVAKELDVTKQE